MNWAISLIIEKETKLETYLKSLLSIIFTESEEYKCYISNIDGTGKIGGRLTRALNANNRRFEISKDELLALSDETGQIFELDLLLSNSSSYRVIIRDGESIDILGDGPKFVKNTIGNFLDLDINLFKKTI